MTNKIHSPFFSRMRFILVLIFLFCAVVCNALFHLNAHADDVFVVILKKEEEKRSSRWSLQDWLVTKQKMKLMDQWLALNSSNDIFEGFIGGDTGNYRITQSAVPEANLLEQESDKFTLHRGHLGLYLSIFGLEGTYEKASGPHDSRAVSGSFNIRLLGTAVQGTNLTFKVGLKDSQENRDQFQNVFWGGSVTLYLLNFLGVEGQYLTYVDDKTKDSLYTIGGKRMEAGAFVDIFFLRFTATWFSEPLLYQNNLYEVKKEKKGMVAGLKIFF